jgi:threonine dehydrogenase-like Zn-dependent dehydrogenase
VELPDSLTYIDGAQVACGFGTVYEALEKIGVSGDDAVLVVGPGPDALAQLRELSGGQRFEKAVDCSAHPDGRALAIRATRQWG